MCRVDRASIEARLLGVGAKRVTCLEAHLPAGTCGTKPAAAATAGSAKGPDRTRMAEWSPVDSAGIG